MELQIRVVSEKVQEQYEDIGSIVHFDGIEIIDVIKRPDAADLKRVGQFYIQVGNNEYFALGQSAWAGSSYSPTTGITSFSFFCILYFFLMLSNIITFGILSNHNGLSLMFSCFPS